MTLTTDFFKKSYKIRIAKNILKNTGTVGMNIRRKKVKLYVTAGVEIIVNNFFQGTMSQKKKR